MLITNRQRFRYPLSCLRFPAARGFRNRNLDSAEHVRDLLGAQWYTNNSLTGGIAPAEFKGFENQAASRQPAGLPGLRSRAPALSRPHGSFLHGVIVSSKITQVGSTMTGDIAQIVVVKTDLAMRLMPGMPAQERL